MKQNRQLCIEKEDITLRFLFKNKRRANNLLIEVNSKTRMKFLGKKMKLGWNVCNIDDYFKINRCYNCSKFNHSVQDCKRRINLPYLCRKSCLAGMQGH